MKKIVTVLLVLTLCGGFLLAGYLVGMNTSLTVFELHLMQVLSKENEQYEKDFMSESIEVRLRANERFVATLDLVHVPDGTIMSGGFGLDYALAHARIAEIQQQLGNSIEADQHASIALEYFRDTKESVQSTNEIYSYIRDYDRRVRKGLAPNQSLNSPAPATQAPSDAADGGAG